MSNSSLTIRDLRVSYGKAEALHGVSLDVEEGTVVCVVGANGAGKTTLIRTISGTLRPSSGDIRFKGRKINEMAPHEVAQLGIAHVPERRRLFSEMTVEENLKVGAHMVADGKVRSARLTETYDRFPALSQGRRKLARQLSGGQQQMLAIARALMSGPTLVMMDEPSQGLSPVAIEALVETITTLNGTGVTILLSEQNIAIGLGTARDGYVLESGVITLSGQATALLEDERVKFAYIGGNVLV